VGCLMETCALMPLSCLPASALQPVRQSAAQSASKGME